MAKTGRPSVMDDLPDALRRSIDEWIRSHAHHSAPRIYRRFNLVERELKPDTFRRYVTRVRERGGATSDADSIERDYVDADDLVVELLIERAETGDAKHFAGISAALRALADRRRLKLGEVASRRAGEKHEAWRQELEAKLAKQKVEADSKLDRLADDNGIPEKVRDAVKKLYGINL